MPRRLVNPLTVTLTIFSLQTLLWWIWMPVEPTLPGGAGRYESVRSVFRYSVFLFIWIEAVFIGMTLIRCARRHSRQSAATGLTDYSYWQKVAAVAGLLTLVGELMYTRNLLQSPGMVIDSIRSGLFLTVGEETAKQRVVGISSLNNLFVIPTAIYALISFDPSVPLAERRRRRRWLMWIGAAVLVHGLMFVGRQLFVTFVLITIGAYLLVGRPRMRSLGKTMAAAVLVIALVLWVGETFRSGLYYAHQEHIPLFSGETQSYVAIRLIEGYFASDVNNAFRLLDCDSLMEVGNGTMWQGPLEMLGFTFTPIEQSCPLWTSITYNTSNAFGIIWWEAGWFGLLEVFLLGIWLGATYVLATDDTRRTAFTQALYLLSFPGIVILMRVNYFGTTIFVAPTLFLLLARMLQPRARSVRSPARRPAGIGWKSTPL